MFIPTFVSDVVFRDEANDWLITPFSVLIWFAFGYFFGRFMWNHLERKFGPNSVHH